MCEGLIGQLLPPCRCNARDGGVGDANQLGAVVVSPDVAVVVVNDSTTTTTCKQQPLVLAHRPSLNRGVAREAASIMRMSLPMMMTGLILYVRPMISMLFLGRLGELALAGGSLAIGFANITGYSVLSGLAMGMEPVCGQAVGAKNLPLVGATMRRMVLLLLAVSVPIAFLWAHMEPLLLLCGQDAAISAAAQRYILLCLPDLLFQSFLHPLRIYLRTQSVNFPLTACAAVAVAIHLPINYLLVSVLGLGVEGVSLASAWANLNLVLLLLAYIYVSGVHRATGGFTLSDKLFKDVTGWIRLARLAVESCASVCLEWWWYEIMILLCGLLANPKATVASMGVLIQTTSLLYIFPSSLSFGVSTRVSNELGANRPGAARAAAHAGLALSALQGLGSFMFALAVRDVWARMFTSDAAILALTASVLPILGLCELGNCPQTTGCGVLRGSARPKDGAHINLGAFYGVGTPFAVALAFWAGQGFKGLWLGLLAAQAACVAVMLVVISRTDWTKQAKLAQVLANVVAPGDDCGRADVNGDGGKDTGPRVKVAAPHGDEDSSLLITVQG
ncbi:protein DETOXIFICATION 49-like [Phragmites australis]|uniref:protein DETOXIFICATION 49-like n=1 Tax=Phragmites australis TaxID=29695 RepID=UPI002D79200E|nr:protein DETOXIFICATION 49-like [Phragmites australis]